VEILWYPYCLIGLFWEGLNIIMNKSKTYPLYFCFGALLLYVVFFFSPSIIGVFYSFTDWNIYSTSISFVGFQNFHDIFFSGNKQYISYIWNTVVFTVVSIIIKTILALLLALLLTTGVKFSNFHRMVAFSPHVLSFMIVGLVFKGMLHPTTGFLNITLKKIGLGFMAQDWLGNANIALGSIIGVDAWKGVGFGMVIFIAGIQSIPPVYYEAAQIDGAGSFQRLMNITIPFLMPTITINVILSLTYGLRVFDAVYVLTNGGPGYATDVINTAVFHEFSSGNYAMGTALSSILSLATILLSYFVISNLHKKVEY
jgi:raffinose/stachyose/melibiose transport system permease protein